MATDEMCQTYSCKEFAAIMGISRAAAYRLCEDHGDGPRVPHFRLGRSVRISKAWVDGYLAGRHQLREPAGV